jgi:hypothetical protein
VSNQFCLSFDCVNVLVRVQLVKQVESDITDAICHIKINSTHILPLNDWHTAVALQNTGFVVQYKEFQMTASLMC